MRSSRVTSELIEKLYQAAKQARDHSYSPYSGYKVGAALWMNESQIFSGCNVENASYGATICAERAALFSAISQGYQKVGAILVLTDAQEPWPPCGLCRQVLSEFSIPEVPVILSNLKEKIIQRTMEELCPYFFGATHLF